MDNSVVIKGSKHGITVVLDNKLEFSELVTKVKTKFEQASKFLGKASVAVAFDGRELSMDEQKILITTISGSSELNIVCIIDNNPEHDQVFEQAVDRKSTVDGTVDSEVTESCQFYKGTLRSGQVVQSDSSIVILGDVNPGGRVIAKGNVIVLGGLRGIIYAGAAGDEDAFVAALEMQPMQIRIGDVIARSSDGEKKSKKHVVLPKIAYVDDGNIYIEDINQDVLSDIRVK